MLAVLSMFRKITPICWRYYYRVFFCLVTFQIRNFNGHSGPNLPDDFDVVTATPLDYFFLLFSAELSGDIARHTNAYAKWAMDREGSVDPYWTDCTPQEVRAFIGINIIMGIDKLPDTRLYWSTDDLVGNAGISKTMTSSRYLQHENALTFINHKKKTDEKVQHLKPSLSLVMSRYKLHAVI